MQGIDDDNTWDIMHVVLDLEVYLTLAVKKDFSILQSPDISIANTGALNDGEDNKKGIINLRKDASLGTM